ncbi:hypothetical protein LVB87_11675 [Lysobacter sp. KIS68-7]|uniref:hypothetical protein n=1 Tax=Lysobacter sp. KIS68-7 TaxID=2904252 RepID=UPI001E30BB70|nr:hypothetical protein [Lysobacter sp. KIS68-7]UHQ18840.1 hypothetical protein LVB87_11675 [Lysobacter sp. KIS68-7]
MNIRSTSLFLVAAVIAIAALAWWREARAPAPVTPMAPVVSHVETEALPPGLRRLLYTRLGQPAQLRIKRVHVVDTPPYDGVACGFVAWGDAAGPDGGFKRFVATRRNVLVEGRVDIEPVWRKVCKLGATTGPTGPSIRSSGPI